MKRSSNKCKRLIALLALMIAPMAQAGPYSNDMSKCLVSSTTKTDRSALVKWMFAAASSHPDVKSISSVTQAQLDDLNKQTARLFVRLLTKSCRKETENAVNYEGQRTISTSFRILGQVAGQELFSDPVVVQNISGLTNYIDRSELEAVLGKKSK